MKPDLSLVIPMRMDRWGFLKDTLARYAEMNTPPACRVETILVVERTEMPSAYSFPPPICPVRIITIDSASCKHGWSRESPARAINAGVYAATSERILKTDAECLPTTPILHQALRAPLNRITISAVDTMDESGNVHPHIPPLVGAYYYAAVFKRSSFLEAGGVDERFMAGYAGDDDEWGERMTRRGIYYVIDTDMKVLHRWHGGKPMQNTPLHHRNVELLLETRRRQPLQANQTLAWDSIVLTETICQ